MKQLLHCSIIPKCCSDDVGQFNYEKNWNRLSEVSHYCIEKMISIALIKEIKMKQLQKNYFAGENYDYTQKDIDEDNCKLIEKFRNFKHVTLYAASDWNSCSTLFRF